MILRHCNYINYSAFFETWKGEKLMAFRNIFIGNPVDLTIKNERLLVKQDKDYFIPLEDINSIVIESNAVNISTYTLAKLIQHKVAIIICDEKHLPCGMITPIFQHSRPLKVIKKQLSISKPLMKKMWQSIIKQKILNQSKCLSLSQFNGAEKLSGMSARVLSGDTSNVEAQAAGFYFRCLFGNKFTRDIDCLANAALNYGYAIIRACIARDLAAHGFETSIGIFHHNELNSFNLADDFIEPFRPIVDLFVVSNINYDEESQLTRTVKQRIYNILNCLIILDGKKYNVSTAITNCIISLIQSMNSNKDVLKLPELIALEEYRHE